MKTIRFMSTICVGLCITCFINHGALALANALGDTKIATVDMQKAIQTVDTGKKAKSDLEKALTLKKKEIQDEEAKINKMGEEFKKQSLVMNDEARSKRQVEIQEKIAKLQQLQMKSQTELQQKEQELTLPILSRLRQIIKELATQKGYTVVLEKNENMVLFSLEKDDLTEDVIRVYNKAPKT